MTESIPDVRHTEISVEKCKVGPITARYQSGGYTDVDPCQYDDAPSRYAICGLDNSHSNDYKVSYASDPLIVFTGETGTTHAELQRILKVNTLWNDYLQPIEVPHGSDEWRVGFKTTPDSATGIKLYKKVMKNNAPRDMDYRDGENGASAFLPHE